MLTCDFSSFEYFVNALLNDVDLNPIAEDGVVIMKILDAIYESARTKKEVNIL